MATLRQSSASLEYIKVPVSQREDGAPVNLSALPVSMAFKVGSAEPVGADWKAASWEVDGARYLARCLVGPGGSVELAEGTYNVWVRVTSDPEAPIKRAGTLVIT